MFSAALVLPLVPSAPPPPSSSQAHSWLCHWPHHASLRNDSTEARPLGHTFKGPTQLIINSNNGDGENNHVESTNHVGHGCTRFTYTDSLRGRHYPHEDTKTREGSVTCLTHARRYEGLQLTSARELCPPRPKCRRWSTVERALPGSPSRNAFHLLPPRPTGGSLTNVTGQTLAFIGPHFTSDAVT